MGVQRGASPWPRTLGSFAIASWLASCLAVSLEVLEEHNDEAAILLVQRDYRVTSSARTRPLSAADPEVVDIIPSAANASDDGLEDLPVSVDWSMLQDHVTRLSSRAPRRRSTRIVLWLHIHKAAGTLMCKLANTARESIVQPQSNCNWATHDMYGDSGKPGNGIPCQQRLAYFQAQSYSWGQIERELFPTDRCWSSFAYGVMLREPLALMRSMMNYHPDIGKRFVSSLQDQIASPTAPDPTQFPLWNIMDNYAVRLLAPALEVPAGQITKQHYLKAKDTLLNFKHIQRLEDLPSNSAELFEQLGWPEGMHSFIHQRVNGASSYMHDFTGDEAAWLKKINQYDIALYESYR
mmetsp:Transcript_23504/g.63955  ORF Transcript_23504/g.63955 Transcript_23504/m.63955 type:complete len:351 (-) Transcript_23504:121-1173(-)